MVQVNYIQDTDDLEVLFTDKIDIPEVVKLDNGVIFEFTPETLSAIILPNFGKMIHMNNLIDTSIEFKSFTFEMLKLKINNQIINIKINLDELENR